MKKRVGDTLIEVTLAVGIFSMVAVAIVAVMAGGNSSAQTALETTLARAEIDAQAEALRFLQSAYIADKDNSANKKYINLWQKITSYANSATSSNITQYTPVSCYDLYDAANNSGIAKLNAFIINTRKLGTLVESDTTDSIDDIIVPAKVDGVPSGKFQPASTYPRLIYQNTESEGLVSSGLDSNLQFAEGIFIVAAKDTDKTTVIKPDATAEKKSSYYDFYIRTCWYGPGDETPSTIATVIRLYDPDAISTGTPETP